MNPPVSTQRVLFDVARRIGLVPAGDNANMDPDKAFELLGFIDDRLREAWETHDIVDTCFVEQRAFAPDFDATVCYPLGAIVWDSCTQQYYQALAQTVGGPLSNEAVWQANPQTISPRWIPWWQDGKTPIGTCYGAWTKNPYEDPNRVRLQFFPSTRGLEFTATSTATIVWLVFRIPYPGVGQSQWDPTVTYNRGDPTIDGTDTYISAIDANLAKEPSTSPDQWTMFRIPYPFSRFVTQAAFADSLVVEGQNEKAPGELNKAYAYLAQAMDSQDLQSGQLETWQGYRM